LAAAERIAPDYEHGVRFIDLSPLKEPSLVASALASVLSLPSAPAIQPTQINSFLADKRMLSYSTAVSMSHLRQLS